MSKELVVSTRTETGKGAIGRARKNGMVPAVLYGKGGEPVMLYMTQGVVDSAQPQTGDDVTLVLDGKKIAAKIMEVQVNYMKSYVVHVDFRRA